VIKGLFLSLSRFWKFPLKLDLISKGISSKWRAGSISKFDHQSYCILLFQKMEGLWVMRFFQNFEFWSVRTRAKETTCKFLERGLQRCKSWKIEDWLCNALLYQMRWNLKMLEKKNFCPFFETGTQGSTKLWTILEESISRNNHKTVKLVGSLIKWDLPLSSDIEIQKISGFYFFFS